MRQARPGSALSSGGRGGDRDGGGRAGDVVLGFVDFMRAQNVVGLVAQVVEAGAPVLDAHHRV